MSLLIRHSISKTIFVCTATVILFTGVASATQTKTESFTTIAPLGNSKSANDFSLPSFDTRLGTLESVDITLTLTSRSKLHIFNDGRTPLNFTNASMTMPISINGPDGMDFNISLTASLASGSAKPGMNTFRTKNEFDDRHATGCPRRIQSLGEPTRRRA